MSFFANKAVNQLLGEKRQLLCDELILTLFILYLFSSSPDTITEMALSAEAMVDVREVVENFRSAKEADKQFKKDAKAGKKYKRDKQDTALAM